MARAKLDVTPEQMESVIAYLETDKATKKAACEMLGIAYNTKRLGTLIEDYQQDLERDKRLRAKKRKEPVTKAEVVNIITDYLSGDSLAELSDNYYRSTAILKYHLEKHGALLRTNERVNELNPPLLPDECMADSFENGQYVWVAKYGSIGIVKAKFKNAYRVKVINESMNQYCYQPPEELGSLEHLIALGVDVKGLIKSAMSDDDILIKVNEGVKNANKRTK